MLYSETLTILRVRCKKPECEATHALIPGFSVPGTSIGTYELDEFILLRAEDVSVEEAGQCFVNKGMGPDYPEQIARRLHRYSRRLNLLFPESAPFPDNPAKALLAVSREVSDALSPVRELHRLCLLKRANPLLFTRSNILLFPKKSAVHQHSHDMPFRHPP